jgi:hypothetical protein
MPFAWPRSLFWVAGVLFAIAAARDAFMPHFFAHGNGSPAANTVLAVVFLVIAARLSSANRNDSGGR